MLHSIWKSWRKRQRIFLRIIGEYGPWGFCYEILYHFFFRNILQVCNFHHKWRVYQSGECLSRDQDQWDRFTIIYPSLTALPDDKNCRPVQIESIYRQHMNETSKLEFVIFRFIFCEHDSSHISWQILPHVTKYIFKVYQFIAESWKKEGSCYIIFHQYLLNLLSKHFWIKFSDHVT